MKTNLAGVWYIELCSCKSLVSKLSKALQANNLTFYPWEKDCGITFGLILMNGIEDYEQLISILHLQLKHLNNRIIVFNISSLPLNRDMILKILNYGAEYVFEHSVGSQQPEYIAEKFLRWKNVEVIINAPSVRNTIIGESAGIKKLLRNIAEVSAYSDAAVLIQGERGSGKESIARLIHDLDKKRNANNFVLVDCTTIRPELAGSEFFGHEKGAYTGADNMREGAFALANNGTLFLDEVGETPLPMQAELLRIVQEGTYKKIGSNFWKQTNFRLVCATNRNLANECAKGEFREDLYDRISIWKCNMPSLNERKQDIPLLVEFFLKKRFPNGLPEIDNSVTDYLQERDYPGNIRELKNLVTRISLKYIGKGPLTLGDIPEQDRELQKQQTEKGLWYEQASFTENIKEALDNGFDAKGITDIVKSAITKIALATSSNNKEVSKLLGKSERWIQLQKARER